MAFQFLASEVREKKTLSWAYFGLLVFISAFLWAPSRDGLQGVYLLAFFLPILALLLFSEPNRHKYGGRPTFIALAYAGFSTISTFWSESTAFAFFTLQWLVLATWLAGSSLVFSKRDINVDKCLFWFVLLGVVISLSSLIYYYHFVFGTSTFNRRLSGWNVFRNANEIGAMCGIIALLAFTMAVQSSSIKRVWLFYTLCMLAGIGMVASFSRGALIAFCVMAFVALIVVRPSLKVWLPPVLMTIITVLLILIKTNLLSRYIDGRVEGFGIRGEVWIEIFHRCRENIFIGIGMAKDTNIVVPNLGSFNHSHNTWLDTFYRTGLIGLTLILIHLKEILQKFSRDPRLLPLYMWLGYGCICNLFDGRCFFWEISAKWFLYWIPAGLIIAIHTGISTHKKPQLL